MKAHHRVAACAAIVVWCLTSSSLAVAAHGTPNTCTRSGFVARSFRLLEIGKSYNGARVMLYNYDFAKPNCPRATNAEWPIDLLFFDDAEINKIEKGLEKDFPYGSPFASTEYARINDGKGAFWAHNGGMKTLPASPGTWDDHYRIYAYTQRNYTTGLGFFVVGTMHRDYNEFAGLTEASYGENEKAETDLAVDAAKVRRWEVPLIFYNMENKQYNEEGNHVWENDGYATMINIKE